MSNRKVWCILFSVATFVVCYFALVKEVSWCWNLILFKSWLMFTITVLVQLVPKDAKVHQELGDTYRNDEHAPLWVDHVYYIGLAIALASTGHFLLAFFHVYSWSADITSRREALKC